MHSDVEGLLRRVNAHRMRELLLDFANIPSPPGDTAIAAEWYAGCLRASGAAEAMVVRDWPRTPCVVAGFPGMRRSPTLEFSGHLDTPPAAACRAHCDGSRVHGIGVAWNKGGLIAAAEAARVLCSQGPLPGGGLLIVAHSRCEAPEGDGQDLATLIRRGMVGDAALITTGDHALAPVSGLALGIFRAIFSLNETAQHERTPAPRPPGRAGRTTIDAAHAFCLALHRRHRALDWQADPATGAESIFVSRIAGGEQFNREPARCLVEGTWRWQPERTAWDIEQELASLVGQIRSRYDVRVEISLAPVRDGYRLTHGEQVVRSLRSAFHTVAGRDLPLGSSTFATDVPIFIREGRVAAISHGLDARSSQTGDEWVAVDDLVRLAQIYICAALDYLSQSALGRHKPGPEAAARPPASASWQGQPVAGGRSL